MADGSRDLIFKAMNTANVTLTGSWIASVGVIVQVLAYLGIYVAPEQIELIVGGFIALYGVIHQIVVHYRATGKLF